MADSSSQQEQESPPDETTKMTIDEDKRKDPSEETTTTSMTYEGTESSESFLLSKRFLAEGNFDGALEKIASNLQQSIESTSSKGEENKETTTNADNNNNNNSLHESLAPLYYLYGTTLLYSIEESTDNLQQQQSGSDEEDADDSQIAWENLETARLILDKMISSSEEKRLRKLRLDLSQIHLRLGDLQRFNGRYAEAATDYEKCITIREKYFGPYHRKVADTHYNLGLTYMSMASEGDKKKQKSDDDTSKKDEENHRNRALKQYLLGAKSFAGEIAQICGVKPEDIVSDITTDENDENARSETSLALKEIRSRVLPLESETEKILVDDLKEILDEIQEIIDEAESAKKAIGEVSELKARAQAAAEGDGGEMLNPDGSTTTIGFGTTTAAAAQSSSPQPVMMVARKKKKKRSNDDRGNEDDDTDASKSPKTE